MKSIAIIPARGGSKGLPRKNARMVGGQPLVAWPIKAAIESGRFDRVICSTDDEEIKALAEAAGAYVPFLRPAEFAGDTASSSDVITHALNYFHEQGEDFDYVCLLEPTSPLTDKDDICAALDKLAASSAIADSIVGMSMVKSAHPDFCATISDAGIAAPAYAPDFSSLKRRQDLQDLYFFDGSLYISSVDGFKRNKGFYSPRTLGYVTPGWKSFEIDELVDLICIEAIMARKNELLNEHR